MWDFVFCFVACVLGAYLNRAAGSELYGLRIAGHKLPGHAMLWVTPVVFLLALIVWPKWIAAAWAGTYLFWRMWPHGRWIDLKHDRSDPNRLGIPMNLFERIVTRLSFGNDYLAWYWRHLMIWPGLVLVIWLTGGPPLLMYISGPVVALILASCHWLAKRVERQYFHPLAEGLHGNLLGFLIYTSASGGLA